MTYDKQTSLPVYGLTYISDFVASGYRICVARISRLGQSVCAISLMNIQARGPLRKISRLRKKPIKDRHLRECTLWAKEQLGLKFFSLLNCLKGAKTLTRAFYSLWLAAWKRKQEPIFGTPVTYLSWTINVHNPQTHTWMTHATRRDPTFHRCQLFIETVLLHAWSHVFQHT